MSKIPTPSNPRLHESLGFWSQLLLVLDQKLHSVKQYGFGEIGVVIKVHKGEVSRIVWKDEVSDTSLLSKLGGMSSEIAQNKKVDKQEKS